MFRQPLTRPTFANRNEPLARGGAGQRRRSALAAAGLFTSKLLHLYANICTLHWKKNAIAFVFKKHKSCSELFTRYFICCLLKCNFFNIKVNDIIGRGDFRVA